MKAIPDVVLIPLVAHPIWGVFMLFSPVAIHTMGIDSTYSVARNPVAATCLMFVASIAAWCSHVERWHGNMKGFMLIALQQFLMLLSLWTIFIAITSGAYANGYRPPEGWTFIAADQILFSLCAVFHTRYVWNTYIRKKP